MTITSLPRRVHVRAPGKINVYFGVGEEGPDGYHTVASVYQAVSLFEDVWVEESDGFRVSVDGSVDITDVPTDERNLALRAARLVAAAADRTPRGVHVHITKHVPVAGGMGGGSADAAASLLACDELWGTELGSAGLQALAAQLGADVPFALMGGTAVGVGRGDQLNPALARGRMDWVIVPAAGLPTPAVYRRLDQLRHSPWGHEGADEPYVEPELLQSLRVGSAEQVADFVCNDLQIAALDLRPELADILKLGERSGALAGVVSGSGPTLVFLAASTPSAIDLQVTLSAAGFEALHAHGPVPGARVMSDLSVR